MIFHLDYYSYHISEHPMNYIYIIKLFDDSLPSDDSPFPNDDKLLNRDDDSLIPFVPLFALTNSKSWVCNDIFIYN